MRLIAVATLLIATGCQSPPPPAAAGPAVDAAATGDAAALFAHCRDSITPAPTEMPLHIAPGLLTTCAQATYPGLELATKTDGTGYVVALSYPSGIIVHVQGDNGFTQDIDGTKPIDSTGYPVNTTGLIQVSTSAPQAVIEYPAGNDAWRYVLTNGQPVAFISP